ncbi:MAG: PKD domain-containing protein [Chitinophagales bacterium]
MGDTSIDCATITNGTSPYAADDSLFLQVIAEDSFCCTGNWDGVCQSIYDELAGNGNGGEDSLCVAIFYHTAMDSTAAGNDFLGGLTVTFWDGSSGAGDWSWDFGDGNTATGPQVMHTYDMEGTYTVCLTILNEVGCTAVYCEDIYITEGNGWEDCYVGFEAYATDATATNAGYNFNFENWSVDNTVAWSWDFGDGATSDEQSPTYTYTEDGIYTVCLTIATEDQCVNTMCYDIVVGATGWGPTGLTLCGSVNVANNFNEPTAYDATVYLIEYDANNNTLTAVDSTIAIGFGWGQDDSSSFSFYCFDGLEEGSQYLVKAAMNEWSPLYNDYLPTYYDGVLSWMDATTVTVDEDLYGIDINMVAGDNPGGAGFIGGNIADGAGKSLSELEGIMVILLDASGNPIGFTHTDEEGNYSFDGIAYGTYTVHIEIINLPSEPVTVTISQDIPMVEDANFIKTNEEVSADFSSSIEDLILVGINGFNVAPNPIQVQTVIGFNAERAMEADLGIFNVMGQRVHQESLNVEAGSNTFEVDASNLPNGIYLIQLSQNGQAVHQVKVVKQ